MTCHNCQTACKRFGKHRNGLQRFRCNQCRKTFTEEHTRPLDEMRIPLDKALTVLQLLLEGMSIRSTERVTGIHRNTIFRLLVMAGERCQKLMDERLVDLVVNDVECDEIWGFVQKKENHKNPWDQQYAEIGDAYCYIALERTTKLIVTHYLGKRTIPTTQHFIAKLAYAASDAPFQLTTDGFLPYRKAIKRHLAGRCHFGQLVKVYASPREGEQRYSPPEVVRAVPTPLMGFPDKERICTSHIERQNLSIRMGMRRMTRLTNAFSKKWENLEAAYSLWFAYYNWCRKHQSIGMTPAMKQGLTDRVWTLAELLQAKAQ
jgi:transposase-like protein/IS1 family transposase